jgi:hypothetical protein
MNNPFKLLAGFALVAVLIAVLAGWLMTARPARDQLGTIPALPSEAPAAPEAAKAPDAAASAAKKEALPNRPAPAVQLPAVGSGRFSLASYRGKAPVILYFFATW